jgi:putative ABC transport system permease protein
MSIPPRWRKVLRDLWQNRTRTFLVVLSIAVGVAAIGMVAGSQVALTTDLSATYAQVNPASANVLLLTTFDEELVTTIQAMDEVAEAEGRRYVFVRFRGEGGEWFNLQLTAVPDFNDMRLNKIWPEEGEWPPPEGTVLIERASFQPQLGLGDVEIGDTLLVEPPDGRARPLTISGTVHDLNQFPAALAGSGYGYITFDTLEQLGEPRNFNQLFFTVAAQKDDRDHIQIVGNAVADRLERANQLVLFTFIFEPGEHPMQLIIDPMSLLLGVMGFLALFLSAFLIVNTLSAILAQEVKQIGIMKAIGAQVPQIMQLYFLDFIHMVDKKEGQDKLISTRQGEIKCLSCLQKL